MRYIEVFESFMPAIMLKKKTHDELISRNYVHSQDPEFSRYNSFRHQDHQEELTSKFETWGWKRNTDKNYIHPAWEHPTGARMFKTTMGFSFDWNRMR